MDRMKQAPLSTLEKKIQDEIFQIVEDDNVERMLIGLCSFIDDIGHELADLVFEEDDPAREHFEDEHIISEETMEQVIKKRYSAVVSPDTIRAQFLSVSIPALIESALIPFRKESNEVRKHAVLPVINALYNNATEAVTHIEEDDLAEQADRSLSMTQDLIRRRIRGGTRLH